MANKRIMGLDYGEKTVGVAISDALGITAQPVETIFREHGNKLRRTYARLRELIADYEVTEIVVGLPKHMNGDMGERAEKTIAFSKELEKKTGLKVSFFDERLTTAAAADVLDEGGIKRDGQKAYIDKIAASLILQGYLELWKQQE
ncbi:MAG: Holliday junction resolvase RuvX [Eubacterium sp.]|nr:Holliday junction resolvase RuvX [Eubacterium sp.]